MWFHQESWMLRIIGPNIGPLLLSMCCLVTSGTCLLTVKLIRKFGYRRLIIAHYIVLCIFLVIHLYPTIWLLLPAYLMLGLTLGPAWICKWSLVVLFASRISCGQHECSVTGTTTSSSAVTATAMMNDMTGGLHDEHKMFCNRNERVRRLARWFHAIQDIGILIGALIASIIISCAANESNCIFTQPFFKLNQQPPHRANTISNTTVAIDKTLLNTLNDTFRGIDISHLSRVNLMPNKSKVIDGESNEKNQSKLLTESTAIPTQSGWPPSIEGGLNILKYYQKSIFSQHDELLDSLFNTNERGVRICGAGSCPTWNQMAFESNTTAEYNWFTFSGTIPITLVYVGLSVIALVFAILSQQIDNTFKFDHLRGITDTLLFAGPMAYFIGTEQAYMIGGFTRVSNL